MNWNRIALEYHHINGKPYPVSGTEQSLWSNLGMLLAEHNMSVLALHKQLQRKGVSVNLKSLYRLAGSQPLQKIDARIVKPICLVLDVDLSELIQLEKPQVTLLKLDPVTQSRISALLDKNNQGTITKRERSELERLVEKAEKISLHNARALVEYRGQRAENSRRQSRKESEATVLA
jgi:DNA-binding Xre family transcriptional regulator